MQQDIAHYDRLPLGDVNRSYQFLYRCCRRMIERNQVLFVRNELHRSLQQGGRAMAAVAGDQSS